MENNYEVGELFYEIKFPTRNVPVALIRPNDIICIKERKKPNVEIFTEIHVKDSDGSSIIYTYDDSVENFKKNYKKVYL